MNIMTRICFSCLPHLPDYPALVPVPGLCIAWVRPTDQAFYNSLLLRRPPVPATLPLFLLLSSCSSYFPLLLLLSVPQLLLLSPLPLPVSGGSPLTGNTGTLVDIATKSPALQYLDIYDHHICSPVTKHS